MRSQAPVSELIRGWQIQNASNLLSNTSHESADRCLPALRTYPEMVLDCRETLAAPFARFCRCMSVIVPVVALLATGVF